MYGLSVTPVVQDEHFEVFGYVIDVFAEADILQKVKKDLLSYKNILYSLNFHQLFLEDLLLLKKLFYY